MASSIQLLRSNNAQERPFPGNLLDGQPAINTNPQEPGLFFKANDGTLIKIGPAAVTSDGNPPNFVATGQPGNSVGELWLDKSVPIPVLKVYDGVQWIDAGSGGGGSPGIVTLQRWVKTAAGGETSLSGPDNATQILSYTPGIEEVFLNGVLLTRDVDYFASSGTSITSLSTLTTGDEVTVLGWTPFNILGAIDGSNLIDGTVSSNKLEDGAVVDAKVSSTAGIQSSKLSYTYPATGAVTRTVQTRLSDRINVTDFGADPSGITDSITAIEAAITAAGLNKTIWFPGGNYRVSRPIRFTSSFKIDGDSALISAFSGFTPAVVNRAGGGTETFRHLLLFLRGNARDIAGPRRPGAFIGNGIRLDGRDPSGTKVANGIYLERMAESFIGCSCINLFSDGIEIHYSWGVQICDVTIKNFPGKGIILGIASNGVTVSGANVWGGDDGTIADYCIFMPDGNDNNGVNIAGCFLEQADYGVYCGSRVGPVHIAGVDFEVITQSAVWAVGDPTQSRICGPIHIDASYLDANGSIVKADKASIRVTDCRFRTNTQRFETDPAFGSIIVENCFSDTGGGVVPGSNVKFFQNNAQSYGLFNYAASRNLPPYTPNYFLRNYQYGDSKSLESSAFEFKSAYQGGGTGGRYLSVSEWWISEYRHEVVPNVLTKQIGVRLDNRTGQSAFNPWTDNTHTLGEASYRWSQVYAVAPAINTSDARLKQQVRDLDEAERAVALRIKKLVKAFKFNDAVIQKGDNARIHVGVVAQEVAEAFEAEGLDPYSYALFCYDEWDEIVEVDEDGNSTIVRQAGNLYGVRYEELLAFIIAAL